MAQQSGPISQGTDAERQMTDVLWRDLFGDEPGVYSDTDGTAYQVKLATDSNTVSVGSSTIDSIARVAGFAHKIPAGQPETIEVPTATVIRNDILALRYDPSFTGAPGPVRLVRIAGTSTGLPAYDASRPGIEDLPLVSITRAPGQALSQATVTRLFPRVSPMLDHPVGAALPTNSPIGTRLWQGTTQFTRTLGGGGAPVWVNTTPLTTAPAASTPGTAPVNLTLLSGVVNSGGRLPAYWREARAVYVAGGGVQLTAPLVGLQKRAVADLPTGFRPSSFITAPTTFDARFEILPTGRISLVNGSLNTIPANVIIPFFLIIPI